MMNGPCNNILQVVENESEGTDYWCQSGKLLITNPSHEGGKALSSNSVQFQILSFNSTGQ